MKHAGEHTEVSSSKQIGALRPYEQFTLQE
jgi:hypothetical protein